MPRTERTPDAIDTDFTWRHPRSLSMPPVSLWWFVISLQGKFTRMHWLSRMPTVPPTFHGTPSYHTHIFIHPVAQDLHRQVGIRCPKKAFAVKTLCNARCRTNPSANPMTSTSPPNSDAIPSSDGQAGDLSIFKEPLHPSLPPLRLDTLGCHDPRGEATDGEAWRILEGRVTGSTRYQVAKRAAKNRQPQVFVHAKR